MPKAAVAEVNQETRPRVGCEHNVRRVIEYPPKVRIVDGDFLVLRCPEGCQPIYVSIGKKNG